MPRLSEEQVISNLSGAISGRGIMYVTCRNLEAFKLQAHLNTLRDSH